jgi:hypothetical protein
VEKGERKMKKAYFLIIAFVLLLAIPRIPNSFCAYPPAGTDTMNSTAHIELEITGSFTELVTALGPTVVARGMPYDPGDGHIKIDTEIISMSLVGTSAYIGPITIIESPSKQSNGSIREQTAGVDFPADSFFDVYIEIQTMLPPPLSVLHNDIPKRMSAVINSIPPYGSVYEGPQPIPLLDQNNNTVGYMLSTEHIIELMYTKPSFPDYAPSGMPDFDEKQDQWGPAAGVYTWCCPVAAANSLWWLDSEWESIMFANPVPPPTISDHFRLVIRGGGRWDDHDPRNVDGLVTFLAFMMDTDGQRTHNVHSGTRWVDVAPGIQQYIIQLGFGGFFQVQSSDFPDFPSIDSATLHCNGVELFIEFWQQVGPGAWTNTTITNPSLEFGHCVTVAGTDSAASQVLISDPYFDVVSPSPPPIHNDTQCVSHDPYTVSQWIAGPGPYGPMQNIWELVNYCQINMGLPASYHAFIRGAVATFGTLLVPTAGTVGSTGYKLIFNETMNNPNGVQATISYAWNFTVDKWDGVQWVASGISGSSTPVANYVIPAMSTVNLPYYVYLLPSSGPKTVVWGDWLRISYTFQWNYSGAAFASYYSAKLHVHPGDIAGKPIAFPYLGASGKVEIQDLMAVAYNWNKKVTWTGSFDPLDAVHIADIDMSGKVAIQDLMAVAYHWNQQWTNTPPPG